MTAPNNRPDYAPERRPGDSLDDFVGAELLVVHLHRNDAHAIASLLEAGSAALKYSPGIATDAVGLGRRRFWTRLGIDAARAIRTEADRLDARDHKRNVDAAAELKRQERAAKKAAKEAEAGS